MRKAPAPSAQERDPFTFRSVLDDCQYCGRTDAVIPSIERQMKDILECFDFGRVVTCVKAIGKQNYGYLGDDEPTVEEFRSFVEKGMKDVVKRARKSLNPHQCCGSRGFYIHVEYGVVKVRWSCDECGWEP